MGIGQKNHKKKLNNYFLMQKNYVVIGYGNWSKNYSN